VQRPGGGQGPCVAGRRTGSAARVGGLADEKRTPCRVSSCPTKEGGDGACPRGLAGSVGVCGVGGCGPIRFRSGAAIRTSSNCPPFDWEGRLCKSRKRERWVSAPKDCAPMPLVPMQRHCCDSNGNDFASQASFRISRDPDGLVAIQYLSNIQRAHELSFGFK
jgi:hypothetical protein